jgi:predicted amidohydrolase YtcJ
LTGEGTARGLAADLVLHSGRIATLDPTRPQAEALATVGNRIVAVGSDADVKPLAGVDTRRVDLRGRRLIPGLMDNHTHYLLAGLDAPDVGAKVNVARSQSIAEIVAEIRRKAAETPPGEWIATSAMYRGALQEGRFPNRHDLDAAAPDHPVYVFQSGKNIIVNSYALRLAGIRGDTPDPTEPEGHIVKDERGEPTGHLIAGAADMARQRWWRRLGQPPKKWDFLYFPREHQLRALEAQGRLYLACGVVAVRDMGVSVDEVEAYVDAEQHGRLPVRADLLLGLPSRYLSLEDVERSLRLYFGPKQGFGGDRLRIGGLKIVVQNDGWCAYSPEKLRALILEANQRGWTLALHVTSGADDEAIELVLGLLEEADHRRPIRGRRFSWEHGLGLQNPAHYRRVRDLGITIAADPLLGWYAAMRSLRMHDVMRQVRIARSLIIDDPWERTTRDWGLPLQEWLEAGLLVTGGTDNPAVPYEVEHPLLGMYAAITGETLAGVLLPGQGITREQALAMWTVDNARATFQEARRGSIQVGKLADLTLLSDDLLSCPEERIKDITVLMTILDGQVVYER